VLVEQPGKGDEVLEHVVVDETVVETPTGKKIRCRQLETAASEHDDLRRPGHLRDRLAPQSAKIHVRVEHGVVLPGEQHRRNLSLAGSAEMQGIEEVVGSGDQQDPGADDRDERSDKAPGRESDCRTARIGRGIAARDHSIHGRTHA